MEDNFSSADVADAFIKQYYLILNKCPENAHKFYQEASTLGWQGPESVVVPVTTLSGINDKIMSSDYKHCSTEIKTTDAQESLGEGIIVSVTGCMTRKDDVKTNFTQTFFLAKQERGFYVLNDILRFCDVCETTTNTAANCDVESGKNSDTKGPVENAEVKESVYHSVSEETLANGAAPAHTAASEERAVSPATKTKEQSDVAPTKNPKVPSVVTPPPNITPITYASIVAKATSVTSPRVASVSSDVQKQSLASPTTKAPPIANGSVKVSTPNVTVSKPVTPSTKATSRPYAEAKGIYIGGLPYNITKQEIVDVLKKFGPVTRYSDNVQIRRHEDGFCCGFVEFESADAACRAVEAHNLMFGEKEAYITYKRSSYNRSNRARSPTRGVNRNGDIKTQDRFSSEQFRRSDAKAGRAS